MEERKCKNCGRIFLAKNARSAYCNEPITVKCRVCGKEISAVCGSYIPSTCSKSCSSKMLQKPRNCMICGDLFIPNSSNQKCCNRSKIKICSICGQPFEYTCSIQSANRDICYKSECIQKHKIEAMRAPFQHTTKKCIICGDEFVPHNNTQVICNKQYHDFTCVVCGKPYQLDINYLRNANRDEIRKTCSQECANKLKSQNNCMHTESARLHMEETCLKKYGVRHAAQSTEVMKKVWLSYKERTGYDHPSHNPDARSRTAKNGRRSNLELHICELFDNYNIQYIQHYFIKNEDRNLSHEFDFYLPGYNILLDADGVYYHSYLGDPDGRHSIDYYDDIRLSVVPSDHEFHLIVEGNEDKQVKEIVKILDEKDSGIFDYDSYLFQWCRSIEFPYPSYTDKRLQSDWASLCKYSNITYSRWCRIGESIIKQFHRSIFQSRVSRNSSPIEAWYDDKKLKRVIKNRCIYVNNIDPSKILRGFNISKICPVVSMFNPILAKYLTTKYLSEFSEVFDPFSGFSGRLLGVASTGKRYVGQDLNELVVEESNQIIQYLNLSNSCNIIQKDILSSDGEYQCLLTCPPYGDKEIYNKETVFKSCDDWISECLNRFKCKKYVFVIDDTSQYADYAVEVLKSTSHFTTLEEKVIVIER